MQSVETMRPNSTLGVTPHSVTINTEIFKMTTSARLTLIAVLLMLGGTAFASTWNVLLGVGNDETRYFFDSDTVVKTRDRNILVWLKAVQTTKANSDGSWAVALRWKMNCSKNTIQIISYSSYNRDGKLILSDSKPRMEHEAAPDSIGEAVLKIACEPIFPNDKSNISYYRLDGVDVFQATKIFVELMKDQNDSAPK